MCRILLFNAKYVKFSTSYSTEQSVWGEVLHFIMLSTL